MKLNNLIIDKGFLLKEKNIKNSYVSNLICRLNKSNKITKIIKGKYTTKDDIYQISTNLFSPSYLSFWSASYFKGYTEQIINQIQIVSTKKHKTISFQNYSIKFILLNKKTFFGFDKIKYGDEFIFVADDEKLLIDSILKEKLLGNFEEIEKILKNTNFNKEKIINYLNKINNKSLNKKIGYLLEKYKQIDLSNEIKTKDKNYVKLSRYLNSKKINKKWKVIL